MDYSPNHQYADHGDFSGDDMHDRGRNNDPMTEVLQRMRRLETRVTTALIALGFDTQAQKPTFDRRRGRLQLPSPHSSLLECTKAIPSDWSGAVEVFVGSDRVTTLVVGG